MRNGRDWNTRLDRSGCEQMPKGVVRHSPNPRLFTSRFEALLAGNVDHKETNSLPCRSCPTLAVPNPLEQIRHRRIDRDVTTVPALPWLNPYPALLFVDILPSHPTSFLDPTSAVRQKLDQIAVTFRTTGSTGSDGFDYLPELLR